MKLFKTSALFAAALMMGLGACSTEEPGNGGQTGQEGDLYATITLRLPAGTRSATVPTTPDDDDYKYPEDLSEDGFEYGQVYENNVNTVTVVLATKDEVGNYTPIVVGNSVATPTTGSTNEDPIFTIRFEDKALFDNAASNVAIFAFCNADNYGSEVADFADLINKQISLSADNLSSTIAQNGNFLMANAPSANIQEVQLPTKEEFIKKYNSAEKAFDLGIVEVARVVSRFDFKQVNNNQYEIKDINDDSYVATIQLLAMAPMNIAKDFYLLPRVSNDGTDAGWTLCGKEFFTNWVVSPWWNEKAAETLSADFLTKYIYQNPSHNYTDENYFKYTYMSDFSGMDDDFDENWGNTIDAGAKSGYKIWRYVTENTLPSAASQRLGISTGVVFKAQITGAAEGSLLAQAMGAGKDVYSYNGTIYGSLAQLRKFVAGIDQNNPLYKAFVSVFGAEYLAKDADNKEFTIADADLKDCSSAANANTFKIFRNTKDEAGNNHYYVYYTYRNRHNDNGRPEEMGTMEFSTVRNNIYKLAVTAISEFGHTGDPGDDPDPEEPEDPDEDPKAYLKVSCRVVPWCVRVNNIEF